MLEIILITNGVRTTVHGTQNTASLSEEVNLSSKLEFVVNYLDESFNNVFPKLTRVIAFDTVPSDVVFEGYVYSVTPKSTQSGEISKTVACVHILSKLNDAAVVGFEDASGNISTMAGRILGVYNANARDEDQIELGYCPVDGGHNEVVHIFSATCLDALTQLVVTDAGWSFRTRYYEGRWYLDISDDFGEISDMDMIFGVNLIDISQELDASELYTRIIPIGGASHIPAGYVNPQMSNLHDPEGMPLTLYNYDSNNPDKIYVANANLEKKYPIIAKVVQYDDIAATDDTDYRTAQGNLFRRATDDAARLTDIVESYKASALDLARAGYDFSLIELNKMYRIVNNKLDIDTYLQVTSKKTNYDNPAKCDLTFGKVGIKSSKWMSRKGKTTDQKINTVGSTSYKTTNTRMGGMSMRNQSKSQYDTESHDANTLYTVSDAGTGKVELYLGDTKISGEEGGGVEVETAVILNNNNMADWEVDEELMLDISAHDKLYYGGHQKMVVVQGHACRYSSSALDDTDALKFGTKLELDGWYREAAADTYVQRHYVIEMYVNDISTSTSGGVTSDRYVFGFTVSRYVPNSSTPEDVRAFYTSTVVNPSDAFIILRVNGISFTTEFTKTWRSTTQTVSTPYGYVQCNNMTITIGTLTEASPTAITYPTIYTNSGSSTSAVYLNQTGSAGNDQYRCVPLGGNAEKYFDMALSKRSEPTGGGNS